MSNEIDKLAWIYVREGKLLSARSKNKKLFYVPGGKREVGETDEEALIREIEEEVSVRLVESSIKYAGTFSGPADGKGKETTVKLSCYFADYLGELKPAAEIEEIGFIEYENKALCSSASIVVMDWLKSQGLIQ